MANTFTTSQLVASSVGSYFYANTVFFRTAYSGVKEFKEAASGNLVYAPGGTLNIYLPFFLKAGTGLVASNNDILEEVIPYTLTQNDLYHTQYTVDSLSAITDIVGGQQVLSENPYKLINGKNVLTDSGKEITNRYRGSQGVALISIVETSLSEKARKAFWYTPIDRPSKLKKINSFSDVSAITTLFDNLNMSKARRTGIMNINDSGYLANSLQNMFNAPINSEITKTAYVGGAKGGALAGCDLFNSSEINSTAVSNEYTYQEGTGVSQPVCTVTSVSSDGSQITFSGVQSTTNVIFNAGTKIAIPAVSLLNRVRQEAIDTSLVVCVNTNAAGDGSGNVTITLLEPLVADTGQANVNILPSSGDTAEIFPGTTNNYFTTDMGYVANALPMEDIYGAVNATYKSPNSRFILQSIMQGDATTRNNVYRLDALVPTLAIPRYGINLLGSL